MKRKAIITLMSIAVFAITSCVSGPQTKKNPGLYDWCGNVKYKSPFDSQVTEKNLKNQMAGLSADWYQNASFYHIWVKAFADSNGDGCGDLKGITQKLTYIKDNVGCDAIWLSPIFDCDSKSVRHQDNMHGYDIINYYEVNPLFGTMADVEELLDEAHKVGIKVIFDFVPNHTSWKNQWFIDSSERKNGKENWYLWNKEPLPWNPMGNKFTWHRNKARYKSADAKPYYYGAFWSGMPDLNFRNYEVREEMKNVIRFWLNKGFDGIRVDAVRYLLETPESVIDTAETHKYFAEMREVVDKYSEFGYPKFMVCEAWINEDRERMDAYFGTKEAPEYHMVFDFDAGKSIYDALNNGTNSVFIDELKMAAGKTYGSFLNNHDLYQKRPASEFADIERQKLAAAALLLRPQIPFIYFGNEYGQKNQDTRGDMQYRYAPDWAEIEKQLKDDKSLLAYHKELISIRNQYSALRTGDFSVISPEGQNSSIAAYMLEKDGERLICVFNFSGNNYTTVTLDVDNLPTENAVCQKVLGATNAAATLNNTKMTVSDLSAYSVQVYLITL